MGANQNESTPKGPSSPEDFIGLISVQVDIGNFKEAERTVADAMKKHPSAYGFHFMKGYVLDAQKQYADAWYEYQWETLKVGHEREIGLAAATKSSDIVNKQRGTDVDEVRAVLKALAEKDAKARLAALQEIENERGERFVLTLWKAEAKQLAGDAKGAAALYQRLIDQDRFFVPAYVGLAQLNAKSGKKADSQKLIAKAKAIDPNHWLVKQH
jgi:tetratricopeptide (TPR) repeat protein